MPASPAALAASGWHPTTGHFANSAALPNPRLGFLGDVFATPSWFAVHSVFSPGDVVIVIGMAVFLHQVCRGSGVETSGSRRDREPTVAASV